jgi:O-antigen/teichoic acid export membrane protein
MKLRVRSLSSVGWVTAEKFTQQVLLVLLFAILAPLLGPRPYGLFAIVMVIVGFCEFVLGEGAIEALVTVDALDPQHTATANVATGVLSLITSLVLIALAPVVGYVFGDRELTWLVWSLVPLPALSLLSAVPIAILRRSFQYRQLAIRTIIGLVFGGLIGLVLAVKGAGVWALIVQVLIQRVVEVLVAWTSVRQKFSIGWSRTHYRDMHSVSINVFIGRCMIFANGQLPRLIIGYLLGPVSLGLFTLANRFLETILGVIVFPRTAVGRVELRSLAPVTAEFQNGFARIVQDVALLAFPILFGSAVVMPDLFDLWLDPRWLPGIIPSQLLILSALPLVLSYCLDMAFLATNNSAVFTKMQTLQATTIILTVVCAGPFGLDVTCLALAVRPWLLTPIYLTVFQKKCLMSPLRVLDLISQPFIAAMVMGGILCLPVGRPSWLDPKLGFVQLVASGVAIYGLYLFRFSRSKLRSAVLSLVSRRS